MKSSGARGRGSSAKALEKNLKTEKARMKSATQGAKGNARDAKSQRSVKSQRSKSLTQRVKGNAREAKSLRPEFKSHDKTQASDRECVYSCTARGTQSNAAQHGRLGQFRRTALRSSQAQRSTDVSKPATKVKSKRGEAMRNKYHISRHTAAVMSSRPDSEMCERLARAQGTQEQIRLQSSDGDGRALRTSALSHLQRHAVGVEAEVRLAALDLMWMCVRGRMAVRRMCAWVCERVFVCVYQLHQLSSFFDIISPLHVVCMCTCVRVYVYVCVWTCVYICAKVCVCVCVTS